MFVLQVSSGRWGCGLSPGCVIAEQAMGLAGRSGVSEAEGHAGQEQESEVRRELAGTGPKSLFVVSVAS